AVLNGMEVWYVGASAGGDLSGNNGPMSVIKDLKVWHPASKGIFFYPSNQITIDGLVIRGDTALLNGPEGTTGVYSGDYMVHGQVIENADIQGMGIGVTFPTTYDGGAPLILEDSFLQNYTNVQVYTMYGPPGTIEPRTIIIRDVRFATPKIPVWNGV